MEFVLRAVWEAFNSAHKYVLHGAALNLWFWFVCLHFLLAIATLGLGDRTVCDIARPLRKIFNPDAESLIEGVLEVAVALPRAVVYYGGLYLRSYILAVRVLLLAYVCVIPALLTPLALALASLLIFGNVQVTPANEHFFELIMFSTVPSWAYWYWRLDAKRLVSNFRRAFQC